MLSLLPLIKQQRRHAHQLIAMSVSLRWNDVREVVSGLGGTSIWTKMHLKMEATSAYIMVRPPGAKRSNAWEWRGRMQAVKEGAPC
jgi:hypothetical protein